MTVTDEAKFIKSALEEGGMCVSAGGPPWRSIEEINASRQAAEDPLQRAATQMTALADPQRMKIIDCLMTGRKNIDELATALKIPLVKVSHHLSLLRSAELIDEEKRDQFVYFGLRSDTFKVSRGKRSANLGWCTVTVG